MSLLRSIQRSSQHYRGIWGGGSHLKTHLHTVMEDTQETIKKKRYVKVFKVHCYSILTLSLELKRLFIQKWRFCHLLLTLILFQTYYFFIEHKRSYFIECPNSSFPYNKKGWWFTQSKLQKEQQQQQQKKHHKIVHKMPIFQF